jgi:membrane dipeptidase
LSNQPWRLDLFRALGLRVLQLTYNQRSLLGDGCSEPEDGGLSEYGVEVVRRCNELGITVDLAHCGPRTTREGVESSTKPVLLSHTGARSVFEHPRAKSDELMQACAQRGGVIGVVGMASLIGGVGSTIDNVLDHVEYIARLVGVDHVGFGLDFITGHERDDFGLLGYKPEMYQEEFMTGQSSAVTGLATIKDMTSLRDGLLHRGFGSADVGLILGGNFVRVFTETW